MKKFSYKKFFDSFTFRYAGNDFTLTVHSIATHPGCPYSNYRDFFTKYFSAAVGTAGLAFLCAFADSGESNNNPTMDLYYNGRLYTWHVDRYGHIVFRYYRVIQ